MLAADDLLIAPIVVDGVEYGHELRLALEDAGVADQALLMAYFGTLTARARAWRRRLREELARAKAGIAFEVWSEVEAIRASAAKGKPKPPSKWQVDDQVITDERYRKKADELLLAEESVDRLEAWREALMQRHEQSLREVGGGLAVLEGRARRAAQRGEA